MPQSSDVVFEKFQTFIDFSWYKPKSGDETKVVEFRYTLTQYSPTVYANISCFIHESYLDKFSNIENMPIENRMVEVSCLPRLFRNGDNKSMFAGPWKFIVYDYKISPRQVHLNTIYGQNPNSESIKGGNHYLVELVCMDKVFYKMSIDEKFKSWSGKISDNVAGLISRNGGKPNVTQTIGKYDWNQTRETDYIFIRRMIPYAKDAKGNTCFIFYCYNNEGFFKQIDEAKKNPTKIFVGFNTLSKVHDSKKSQTIKNLIEKFGSLDNLMVVGPGFRDFEKKKPKKMNIQSYQIDKNPGKMHDTKSKKIIQIPIEINEMMETFATSIRKTIHRFSRMLQMDIYLDTEITPSSVIEIVNYDKEYDQEKILDGLYYVVEVCHRIGLDAMQPFMPMTRLTLSTDVDFKGMKSPEGQPLDKDTDMQSSKPKQPDTPKSNTNLPVVPQSSSSPTPNTDTNTDNDNSKKESLIKKAEEERNREFMNKFFKMDQPFVNNNNFSFDMLGSELKNITGGDTSFTGLISSSDKIPSINDLFKPCLHGFETNSDGIISKIWRADTTVPGFFDLQSNKFFDYQNNEQLLDGLNLPDWISPDNRDLETASLKQKNRMFEMFKKRKYKSPPDPIC